MDPSPGIPGPAVTAPDATKLEVTKLGYKRNEVDAGSGHDSTIGKMSGPEVHLRKIGSDVAAYLRVAHIYMLISMPTDTSTIFGVFQAIWLSLWYRTNSALGG
jgi:hypothetical protein